jgi:small-conductance mechanosensitive channel
MHPLALDAHPLAFLPKPEQVGDMALRIGITIAVAALFQWLAVLAIGRGEKLLVRVGLPGDHDEQRAKTLGQLTASFSAVLIGGAAMVHVLGILGWDVTTLLAGAGVLGLALSFGAQTLVKDTIAGVFILAEDQFAVGDLIEVAGKPATVEAISLRYTRLRDFNGYLHFVPNGEMRIVTNRSRGWQRLAVDVPVASDQNLEGPLRVVRSVAEAMNDDPLWRERLLDPIEVWGVESLGPSEATLRVVLRAAPGPNAPEAARELRARVHNALMRAGHKVSAGRDIQITQIPASDAVRSGVPA